MREHRVAGERWRTVPGIRHLLVSDLGRVYACSRFTAGGIHLRIWRRGRLLRGGISDRGYLRVKPGEVHRTLPIHQMVLLAFVGPPPDGLCVDHINGVKTDNRLTNLRYLTPSENSRIAMAGKPKPYMRGENNARTHLNDQAIKVIRHWCGNVRPETLANLYGIGRTQVYRIARRESWGHV